MELHQLEYFVAVAEERSFTRAAQRVHVSQPGVSAQVRRLERELGADLFDRSTRNVRLTPAGAAALEHAKDALGAAAAVRRSVEAVAGLVRGSLRVGMVVGCTVTPFFDAVAALHAQHPGVGIALTEGVSDRLVAMVRAGDLDVALVGVAGGVPADLGSRVIISEPLAVMVPARHELADRSAVKPADLADRALVTLPTGTGIRGVLDQVLAGTGTVAQVAVEASAAGAVADLTERGLGVGVLSASMAAGFSHRVRVLALDAPAPPAVLAIVWSRTVNPATTALVRLLEQAFG